MQRIPVVDADGTTRETKRVLAVDAGGATRTIARGFVIDAGGVARQFWPSALVFMTATGAGHTSFNPQNAFAAFALRPNGDIQRYSGTSGSNAKIGQWITPSPGPTVGNDYECRATFQSGVQPTGTYGVWTNMGFEQSWGLSQTLVGQSKEGFFLLEIRRANTAQVLTAQQIRIFVEKSS